MSVLRQGTQYYNVTSSHANRLKKKKKGGIFGIIRAKQLSILYIRMS